MVYAACWTFIPIFESLARRQADETLAFAVLDLDGFDEVNDALGYAGGDEVLGEMGKRLAHSLCAGATIGRLGSDEFALLIDDVDQDEALAAAEALGKSLGEPNHERVVAGTAARRADIQIDSRVLRITAERI